MRSYRVALAILILSTVSVAAGGAFPPAVAPNVQVTNAPTVLDFEVSDARAQREWVASTNTVAVASGSYLNVEICNAAGSGRLVTITERRFDNNVVSGQVPMGYGGIASPAPIASPNVTSTGTNNYGGGATSGAVTLTAAVSTTRLNNAASTATPTATGFLPVNGDVLRLMKIRLVPPGFCFGNFIVGQNQSSNILGGAAAQAGLTVYWTEEPM